MRRRLLRSSVLRRPPVVVALVFAAAILVGTVLLWLPIAREAPGEAPFSTALFTSTSAVTVTSSVVVDTATYWSTFGQATIIVLVQVGGLGILTGAALLFLVVLRRLGLRTRLIAQAETPGIDLGDLRRIVRAVGALALVVESLATVILGVRLWLGYDYSLPSALWRGLFLAIGAFNNAGFSLWSDNLVPFVTDGWMSVTVAVTIIIGGLGVPVWLDVIRRDRTPHRLSLHTRLTLTVSGALLVLGTVAVIGFEWSNPATLGALDAPGRLVAGFFQAVSPRSAGFNSIDYGAIKPETAFSTDTLMFVGTASGSTGGGIKVTTLAVLLLTVLAELRGEPEVTAFRRQVATSVQRQAVAITVISTAAVLAAALAVMSLSSFGLSDSLFETISAFGTVGLSTGGTGSLPDSAQAILIALMYLGRVGPLTLGVALALRERRRLYRFPEERPMVG
jgi:trk/ktr system potassium uptake protein